MALAIKHLGQGKCKVGQFAKFLGVVVASFQGVKHGALWYRSMKNDKIKASKQNKGNYEANGIFQMKPNKTWLGGEIT